MAARRILFVDSDPQAVEDFRRVLGADWDVKGSSTAKAALSELRGGFYNVVVASHSLPDMEGTDLLARIRTSYPGAVGFIAGAPELALQIEESRGGYQFLAKPFDPATLKKTIEHPISAENLVRDTGMRALIARIRVFPTIPSLYLEVTQALDNPTVTTEEIGAIVAKDMAMTTKVLQVLNSPYFSLPQPITEPAHAIGILGFDTIKSLILSLKLMSQYSQVKPVYFSIDSIWRHSTNVAPIAKEFILREADDPVMAAAAYTAGLMHDLGKVILAANFDQQYNEAHTRARAEQRPLPDLEKEIFGVSHGEIGAYLLNVWRMPREVIEAAALHHQPGRAPVRLLSPLTAVHVANVLEHEVHPSNDGLPPPTLDLEYLNELGLADHVEEWRRTLCDPAATRIRMPSRTAPPRMAAISPLPAAKKEKSMQAPGEWNGTRVLYAALGLAALIALLCWVGARRAEQVLTKPEPVPPPPVLIYPVKPTTTNPAAPPKLSAWLSPPFTAI